MSKILFAALTCCATLFVGVDELRACGDKFLVGLRGGPHFRYQGSVQPTRILVYWHADPETDPGDAGDTIIEASLKEVGHSVEVVRDPKTLYEEAASRDFEIILMGLDRAREERQRIEGVSPDSSILPVLHFPTRREFSEAKKEFGHAIKTPTTMPKLISQIEKARPSSQ